MTVQLPFPIKKKNNKSLIIKKDATFSFVWMVNWENELVFLGRKTFLKILRF